MEAHPRGIEKINFPEHIQAVLGGYLKDRIAFSGDHFTWLEKGCPQGSVLGPLLWIIAYNYLIVTLKDSGVAAYCYADDTVIILSGSSPESIASNLTVALTTVSEILLKSGLKLNDSKTEIVVFPGGDRKIKKKINLIVCFKCTKLVPKLLAICQNYCGYSNEARRIMLKATIVQYTSMPVLYLSLIHISEPTRPY